VTSPLSGHEPAAPPDALVADAAPGVGRLRDDPDFRRYWWSRVLSWLGTLFTTIALPVLVYRLSHSAVLTALVTTLEALPYVLLGLFAGALSDRTDRRRLMVVTDALNALAVGSVPLAHALGVLTVAQVMVVAFVVSGIAVFFDGANFGALPVLVGRDRIAEANAAVWGTQTVLEIVVPSAVGIGLAVVDPSTMLAVDTVSYVASAWFITRIGRHLHDVTRVMPPLSVRSVLDDIREGLDFLVHHAGVRTMTLVGWFQCVAGGGFVALMVVWCDRVLDIGTQGLRFGLVYGSWSIGALAAAVALPRLLRRVTAAQIALAALPMSAALGVVTSLVTTWQLAIVGLLSWSVAYTLTVVNAISYRQQVTPEHLMGRVNTAGRMLAWGLGWSAGGALAGVLGHAIGIRPALVAVSSATFLAVVVAWTSPLRSTAGRESRAATTE
jgi:Transmembrane secretion effector